MRRARLAVLLVLAVLATSFVHLRVAPAQAMHAAHIEQAPEVWTLGSRTKSPESRGRGPQRHRLDGATRRIAAHGQAHWQAAPTERQLQQASDPDHAPPVQRRTVRVAKHAQATDSDDDGDSEPAAARYRTRAPPSLLRFA